MAPSQQGRVGHLTRTDDYQSRGSHWYGDLEGRATIGVEIPHVRLDDLLGLGKNGGQVQCKVRLDVPTKSYGQIFSFLSLLCSLSFWLALGLSYAPRLPQINLAPGRWLWVEILAVVLAAVGAVRQSRVWPIALSLALGTFLFVM
jgi:hypothetical protein